MLSGLYLYSKDEELKSWMIIAFKSYDKRSEKPVLTFNSRWEDTNNDFGGGSMHYAGKACIDKTCHNNIDWKNTYYGNYDDEYEDDLDYINSLPLWEDHMDEIIEYIENAKKYKLSYFRKKK